MCRAWACTPLAMEIGMGAGASSVYIVIPSITSASYREGVVDAPELMFLESVPLVSRVITVMGEGRIGFRRAIRQVFGRGCACLFVCGVEVLK